MYARGCFRKAQHTRYAFCCAGIKAPEIEAVKVRRRNSVLNERIALLDKPLRSATRSAGTIERNKEDWTKDASWHNAHTVSSCARCLDSPAATAQHEVCCCSNMWNRRAGAAIASFGPLAGPGAFEPLPEEECVAVRAITRNNPLIAPMAEEHWLADYRDCIVRLDVKSQQRSSLQLPLKTPLGPSTQWGSEHERQNEEHPAHQRRRTIRPWTSMFIGTTVLPWS